MIFSDEGRNQSVKSVVRIGVCAPFMLVTCWWGSLSVFSPDGRIKCFSKPRIRSDQHVGSVWWIRRWRTSQLCLRRFNICSVKPREVLTETDETFSSLLWRTLSPRPQCSRCTGIDGNHLQGTHRLEEQIERKSISGTWLGPAVRGRRAQAEGELWVRHKNSGHSRGNVIYSRYYSSSHH